MPVRLIPMQSEQYPTWFARQAIAYAEDKVRAKQWGLDGAEERARQETESLLTDGIETPGHHLLNIIDDDIDAVVGTLWWAHSDRFGRKVAFIFDLTIQAKFRRKGYASSTLKHLESMVRTAGYEALSLHVFAFNTSAQALYEKMGYTPTSMSMTREL